MAPCTDWITLADIEADSEAAGLDPAALTASVVAASEILYRLSGRQFAGLCSDVVRPCGRGHYGIVPGWWWWDQSWGVCASPGERDCGCGARSQITLGAYPLRAVSEVRIDGGVVDPNTYRVDDRRWLVRLDGGWPSCQTLTADPLVDSGTFQVTFTYGQAPPESGVLAARELALELAKSMSRKPCNLPQRVQNISMQGVSYALLDPLTFLDKGRTGIYYVDMFLASVNPKGLARRPSVISPDVPRPVRRTNVLPGS